MATIALSLLILDSMAYAQGSSAIYDFASAASSISAFTTSPSFTPYSKPSQKVEEWIALGDSYTAGTGCNGLKEILAGDAARGKRAFPMQMSTNADSWSFINNDDTLPRFTFSAYVGDTTVELATEQLKQGAFVPHNIDLPRHAMGKPQLAVVTIGGNDAGLSTILNNCIYRVWFPGNYQSTLTALTRSLDDGSFQQKITTGLFHVANAGQTAGGAEPIQSFQVYVTSYTTFFNENNPECDSISWRYWGPGDEVLLTVTLRKQLNGLVTRVNSAIQAAAHELKNMGVIYVDGLEDSYQGHRFCEPGHTYKEMIDDDTWFWSRYAPQDTTSEGPGEPNTATTTSAYVDDTQLLLNFLFPNGTVTADDFSPSNPPWEQPGLASKYPDIDALLAAMNDDNATVAVAPFNILRSFHPKGSPYSLHAQLFLSAIANNRDTVSAQNASTSSTGTSPTAWATGSVKPVAAPQCQASDGVVTSDAQDAQQYLATEGNDRSDDRCCAGGTTPCKQIAINGTAAVDLCGGTTQQCAECDDLAVALKDIIFDCTKNDKVGGKVAIPYLTDVTLRLNLNDGT